MTGNGAARGVELQQLFGHVAHGFLDAALGLLPGRAAQTIERRPRRAGVLLNEIEPLDGDEELVLRRVAQLHELLRLEADLNPLQADEHADAMIDVHDEVVGLEIAKVREECGGCRPAALVCPPLLVEDVGLGPELETGIGKTKPLGKMPDRDEHGARRRVLTAFDRGGRHLVVGEQLDDPFGTTL